MGRLIFAYCLAGFFAFLPLLPAGRLRRQVDEADEQRLKDLRRVAESRWMDYLLAVWASLTFVGATFALIRGHAIGWAWLGVAALYALGIVTGRRHRRRLLQMIGDRGRVEMPERYRHRASKSYQFLAVGVTGYIGMHVMDYAYPHDLPTWAEVTNVAFGLVLAVGVIGFLVIRLRMYLAGDDLQPTGR